jgi:response regulator RpfG family c-di-GMP phosphodiesterase
LSLTESKLIDLQDKKFDKLFEKKEEEWMEMASNAYNVARDHVCGRKEPRQDDVLKVLLPMLETNETLRKHQEQHKARFKHYREAFAEYMIDIYFKSLTEKKQ